jgi:hypothetical protein
MKKEKEKAQEFLDHEKRRQRAAIPAKNALIHSTNEFGSYVTCQSLPTSTSVSVRDSPTIADRAMVARNPLMALFFDGVVNNSRAVHPEVHRKTPWATRVKTKAVKRCCDSQVLGIIVRWKRVGVSVFLGQNWSSRLSLSPNTNPHRLSIKIFQPLFRVVAGGRRYQGCLAEDMLSQLLCRLRASRRCGGGVLG